MSRGPGSSKVSKQRKCITEQGQELAVGSWQWARRLPHALFFPGRDWSEAWLRLNARRLAVPKEARFGPPPGRKN